MNVRFCLECGSPLQKQDDTEYTCENEHSFWNNPKGAVCVIIIKDNKILISKRGIEPQKDKFDFPGGYLEFNEQPTDAARREILEETGLVVRDLTFFSAFTHIYAPNNSVTDILFVSKDWSGQPKPQDDVADLSWESIDVIDSPQFAWHYPGLVDKLKQNL